MHSTDERVIGLEPTISCLGSKRSTTELHPRFLPSFQLVVGTGKRSRCQSEVYRPLGRQTRAHRDIHGSGIGFGVKLGHGKGGMVFTPGSNAVANAVPKGGIKTSLTLHIKLTYVHALRVFFGLNLLNNIRAIQICFYCHPLNFSGEDSVSQKSLPSGET